MTRSRGFPYFPFLIRFSTLDGRRRRVTFWSPGLPWLRGEINRYLDDRNDVDSSRSVLVRERKA